jgi:hypothetical protein
MTDTSAAEMTTEQAVEAVYRFAAQQMRDGIAPAEIRRNLIEQGLSVEVATIVVDNLQEAMAKAHSQAGQKNMLFGALWCIGGIVVTVATYSAAASAGEGRYIIAWGAIVFGAVQFFRGLIQASGRQE